MKRVVLAASSLVSLLLLLTLWKNSFSYKAKSKLWIVTKSVCDTAIIVTSAIYLPQLLVAWCALWLTRPFGNNRFIGVKMTIGIIVGTILGVTSFVFIEILVLFSVVAVDLVTGQNGWWGFYERLGNPDVQKI